jgi:hypothetical protein
MPEVLNRSGAVPRDGADEFDPATEAMHPAVHRIASIKVSLASRTLCPANCCLGTGP